MLIDTIPHPTQPGIEVESVTIDTAADMRELRESDWHDGTMRLLSFPTQSPVGYINADGPPLSFGGIIIHVGDTVLKGPGGDFEVIAA